MAGRPGSRRARLLVLGAGPAQLGLLEAARARGDVHVIAVDRDPNAVGFALADERALLSSEDEEGIDRLARALAVDGIVSPGADWPVGIAARVAARMGLAHPLDPATAAIATSKLRQRGRFVEAGVPHPRGFDPGSAAVALPVVVKAPDRQGQRGLALVRRLEEFAPALEAARAEARGGGVLVEELIEGPEVTVNAVSVGGVFVPLLVTDRLTAEPPAFGVALMHVWPSLAATDAVVDVARAAVEAIGLTEGPSYTQLRIGPDGPVVVEVAARLGGGHDAELVRAVTGVDLADLAIAFALGEAVEHPTVPAAAVPAALRAGHRLLQSLQRGATGSHSPAGSGVPTGSGFPIGSNPPTGSDSPSGSGVPTGSGFPIGSNPPTGSDSPAAHLALFRAAAADAEEASNTVLQSRLCSDGVVGGGCVAFLVPPVGLLRSVSGLDDASVVDGVGWVRLYRRQGHVFGPLLRGADRAGAVLAVGASRESALARAARAAALIDFDVEP